jgi:transcriptional regulator NrdR family protein
MVIIKKSGKTEPFAADKIRLVLAACSDEAGQPLTESALKGFVADLLEIVGDMESVRTEHISVIVAGLLYTKGYIATLERYWGYKKKPK